MDGARANEVLKFDINYEDYDPNTEQALGHRLLGGEVYLKKIDDFMMNTKKGDSFVYLVEKFASEDELYSLNMTAEQKRLYQRKVKRRKALLQSV